MITKKADSKYLEYKTTPASTIRIRRPPAPLNATLAKDVAGKASQRGNKLRAAHESGLSVANLSDEIKRRFPKGSPERLKLEPTRLAVEAFKEDLKKLNVNPATERVSFIPGQGSHAISGAGYRASRSGPIGGLSQADILGPATIGHEIGHNVDYHKGMDFGDRLPGSETKQKIPSEVSATKQAIKNILRGRDIKSLSAADRRQIANILSATSTYIESDRRERMGWKEQRRLNPQEHVGRGHLGKRRERAAKIQAIVDKHSRKAWMRESAAKRVRDNIFYGSATDPLYTRENSIVSLRRELRYLKERKKSTGGNKGRTFSDGTYRRSWFPSDDKELKKLKKRLKKRMAQLESAKKEYHAKKRIAGSLESRWNRAEAVRDRLDNPYRSKAYTEGSPEYRKAYRKRIARYSSLIREHFGDEAARIYKAELLKGVKSPEMRGLEDLSAAWRGGKPGRKITGKHLPYREFLEYAKSKKPAPMLLKKILTRGKA